MNPEYVNKMNTIGTVALNVLFKKKNSPLEYKLIYQGMATNESLMLIYFFLPLLEAI